MASSNLDIQMYVPLKTVVAMFIDQYEKSIGDEDRLWVMAHRALALINKQVSALPKSIVLPVESNQIAYLPKDYNGWTKIGIMDDNGQINTLSVNKGLSRIRDTSPDRLSYLQPQVQTSLGLLINAPFFFNFFGNGVYYNTPLFGFGGGLLQFGSCQVDEEQKVIIFPPDFRYSTVILEYLNSPKKDSDYQIETCLQEAVISFLEWKLKLGTRQDFYAAVTEGRRALPNKRVTLQNIHQAIREASGMYNKS